MRQVGSEFILTILAFFADLGPSGQWWYLFMQQALFYGLIMLTVLSFFFTNNSALHRSFHLLRSNGVFALLVFLFVVISRLPAAIYGFQNPDEGVWIACTKALMQDARLWVSADTSTSGPLVLVPLLLLKLFSLPLDFGSIKLAAGITMGLTLVFTFFAYCNAFGRSIARMAIIPPTIALSLTTFWDFFTYNGEHMPLLILSASFYLLSDAYFNSGKKLKNFIFTAFLLGMTPFAKLQSVPMALMVAALGLGILLKRYELKHVFYYILSGLVPTIIILLWVTLSGGLSNFWNSYILYNVFYAVSETPAQVSLIDKIILAWRMLFNTDDLTFYFQASFVICLFGLLALDFRRLFKEKPIFNILLFSILYFLVALFCIGQPYRAFTHYTYLAYFSINISLATLLSIFFHASTNGSQPYRWNIVPGAVIILISIFIFAQRFNFYPGYIAYADVYKGRYVHAPEVIHAINQHSAAGDKIAIWGWNNNFYAETDLIMGTRYTDPSGIFVNSSFQNYFLEAYMFDLQKNKPKIFLDAINPNSIRFTDRRAFGFDKFPVIRDYVGLNYKEVADIDGYRVYVRQ